MTSDAHVITSRRVHPPRSLVSGLALAAWIVGCNLVGVLGAAFTDTASSAWYQALEKPSFQPPPWLFAPVWTLLYTLMGIAAWRIWRRYGWSGAPGTFSLFAIQLVLNGIWTPVFFGAHDIAMALVIIGALWVAIVATMGAFWRKDRIAGGLLVPYLAWVSFATALNASIVVLNR